MAQWSNTVSTGAMPGLALASPAKIVMCKHVGCNFALNHEFKSRLGTPEENNRNDMAEDEVALWPEGVFSQVIDRLAGRDRQMHSCRKIILDMNENSALLSSNREREVSTLSVFYVLYCVRKKRSEKLVKTDTFNNVA